MFTITLSIIFQVAAAFFSFQLLLRRGRRIAGLLMLTIIVLMAIRRVVSLHHAVAGVMPRIDLDAESIALSVSVLLLLTIAYINRLVRSEQRMASQLADSRQHYEALFNQSPDGILLIDLKGHILEFNDTAARDLGYTREEFAGIHLSDIDPNDTPEEVQRKIEDIIKNGGWAEFEVQHRTKSGDVRDVYINSKVIDLNGEKVFHAIWRDITERKRAADELQESQARFQAIFEQSNDGITVADREGRYVMVNPVFCRMTGYSRDELLNMRVHDMLPEDVEIQLFKQVSAQKEAGRREVQLRRKDGSRFFASISGTDLRIGANSFVHGIVQDITERKQAETALKEAYAKLHTLLQALPDAVFFKDGEGRYLMVNKAFEQFTGLRQELVIGKTDADFMPADIAENCRKSDEAIIKNGKIIYLEDAVIGKDGEKSYFDSVKIPVIDPKGRLLGLVGVSRDVTERKQSEEKIRQNEEFIRSILETVDEGFIVIDRDYRILTANRAYCSQIGRNCDDVIGRHCHEVSHQKSRPCYEEGEDCAVRQVFATGEAHTALHRHRDRDGQILYVETKGYPIKDQDGTVTSVIETVNNITEKHLLEEERLKTQKLESIGTLAGGIAHDFNNLLQGIFGYISMAKLNAERKDRALVMLEQAENALHQSVNLTTQLLTFSRGGKPVRKLIDLRPVIENSTRFTLSGSRSDYHLDIAADLWHAEADAGQVGQVIQNIVLNADQAMPNGGSVTVRASNRTAGDPSLPQGLRDGNYVCIVVQDNGSGISEHDLSRIFDPYFTTKEKGSGLGLATSYSIIKNHDGMIDVKTTYGEGSSFLIYLPAAADKAEESFVQRPEPAPMNRQARVLVMDDEELLRDLSKELLAELGHDVETARHGQEALDKYEQAITSGKPFDIVILDLTVRGGMGGAETMRKLREIHPAVKAIVSSGYSEDSTVAQYQKHGFKAYLKKPYDIDQLHGVISALLS